MESLCAAAAAPSTERIIDKLWKLRIDLRKNENYQLQEGNMDTTTRREARAMYFVLWWPKKASMQP